MAKGTIAMMLLTGQLSVDACGLPLSVCATCGCECIGNGALLIDSELRQRNKAELLTVCRACAERVALGIINVLTGSAWGIPLSNEGRALMEAQQSIAEAAREVYDEVTTSETRDAIRIVHDGLSKPLKAWREKSDAFVASFARPPVSTISETPLFGNPSTCNYPIKRSDVDRRQAERREGIAFAGDRVIQPRTGVDRRQSNRRKS